MRALWIFLLVSCAATRASGLCRQNSARLRGCLAMFELGDVEHRIECVRASEARCREQGVDSGCCAPDWFEAGMSP